MLETYPAILCGDRIVWRDERPKLAPDTEIVVYVTVDTTAPEIEISARGAAMGAILERIAERNETEWPEDVLAWQKEIRADRNVWEKVLGEDVD